MTDRTMEALTRKIAEVQIWRDVYHDGPDIMSGELKLTPDDVRAARAALTPSPPAQEEKPCDYCKGEKGFYDTTYNRAGGDWVSCPQCHGTGEKLSPNFIKDAIEAALARRRAPVPPQEGGIAEVEGLAFDFENEGILLAEKASSWRGDWCDYAMLAENVLKEAHEAGRAAQAAELSRLSALVKAQKEALAAVAPVEDVDFIADDQAIVLHFVKDGISYNFPAFTWGDLRRARALSEAIRR